ncbi:MAG: hypothetical protein HC937_02205 [Aquincola sp.]|nr:hypothetical protein [Aquincola sp.]
MRAILPLLRSRTEAETGAETVVLSLQNGVDKDDVLAAAVGRSAVLGAATYIFANLSEPGVVVHSGRLQWISIGEIAGVVARIDVLAALAELAVEGDYVRPAVKSDLGFKILRGRHPVVEAALKREAQGFVANDCDLSANGAGRLWLVTGPNMAGKSTFLRQNALIALLAQSGSHVPATNAHIGLVSQLFSRVGASDDLARAGPPSWWKWSKPPPS